MLKHWFHRNVLPSAIPPPVHGEPIRRSFDEQVVAAKRALMLFLASNERVDETLQRLAVFCQRLPTASGDRLLWDMALVESITAVKNYPIPPENCDLTVENWRYLVFARTLLDQLEVNLAGWRIVLLDDQGSEVGDWTPTNGPMTDVDGAQFYRVHRLQGGRGVSNAAIGIPGLGNVLAAYLLQPEGLDRIVDTARIGIDWTDRAVLWQSTVSQTEIEARSFKSTALDQSNTLPEIPPSSTATSLKEGFQAALHDYIEDLIQRNDLNHLGANGWVFQDALYLVGKEVAAALRKHPALSGHVQRLQKNAVLYRLLLACQVTEQQGDKPVWNIIVMESGESRKAATLKIPLTGVWSDLREQVSPFKGAMLIPGQITSPVTQKKTYLPISKTLDNQCGYSTLFED
jgi:hypothetical protein